MMSISGTCEACNCDPVQIVHELKKFVDQSVSEQTGMREFERGLFDWLLVPGFVLTEEFLRQQGDGDCGETCEVAEKTAYRSEQPAKRRLRTIFGEHQFEAFVYRSGKHPNNRIVFRPVDDQLGIDTEQYSPLVQEFTMALCCEQAFHVGAETFETFFGQKLSVDTLERTSRIMGQQTAEFMDALSDPPVEEEGEFLVQTADCKGVPMVREDAQKLRVCHPKPHPSGNRHMTTVAAVYSVPAGEPSWPACSNPSNSTSRNSISLRSWKTSPPGCPQGKAASPKCSVKRVSTRPNTPDSTPSSPNSEHTPQSHCAGMDGYLPV